MFINENELYTAIPREYVEEITQGDSLIIEACIDTAITEMQSYLSDYEVEQIFSAKGSARHSLLVQFAKDIAIYNLIELDRAGIDSEDRRARYERAIAWLKEVKEGTIKTSLTVTNIAKTTAVLSNSRERTDNIW